MADTLEFNEIYQEVKGSMVSGTRGSSVLGAAIWGAAGCQKCSPHLMGWRHTVPCGSEAWSQLYAQWCSMPPHPCSSSTALSWQSLFC